MTQSNAAKECPVCQSLNRDGSLDQFEHICVDCGFVIDSDVSTTVDLLSSNEGDEHGEQDDWLEVCRVRNATEKRLAQSFDTLESLAREIGLNVGIRKATAEIYCDAFRVETTDGRDTLSLMAACLRLASVSVGEPIPTSRIMNCPAVDESKLRRSLSALREELDIEVGPLRPLEYLPFVASVLDLAEQEITEIHNLLEEIEGERCLSGKDPVGITAAAVYSVADECTQAEVAEAVGISTETIRVRSGELQELTADA
jgi:transcription initiation factor TFIIB